MKKHKNTHNRTSSVQLIIAGLFGLGICIAVLLRGVDITLLNPKGLIAEAQLNLMLFSVLLLLTIAIPTLILLYGFAWKYRESNQATYDPHVRHSKFFVFSMWTIPSVFMLILALVMWPATHKLEPQKSIAANTKPITIQVVAMRWKWLFIYPEQNIATVNFVQIPTGTPVQFELTADETPMSSFWIPHLAGQLYAMTGHVNRLNLVADHEGDYPGSTAEINGAGFAGMKFITRVSSEEEFKQWIQAVQQSQNVLNSAKYGKLLRPSENNPIELYSSVQSDLYAKMLMKYAGAHDHQPTEKETDHQ
jgi:cytochrome o ubiquinol oxidase subunit II